MATACTPFQLSYSTNMVGALGIFIAITAILVVAGADEPKSAALVGSTSATDGEFPYQASVEKDGEHFCGGAIISDRHIATAAHCVAVAKSSVITVVVGSIIRGQGRRFAITQRHFHHEYRFTGDSPADIAVVVLAGQIVFNQYQQAIEIASTPTPDNGIATVTGWGFTFADSSLTDILQKLNVDTLTSASCSSQFAQASALRKRPTIWNSHICTTSTPGSGTCYFDSGGPLVSGNQLIGIVAFGIPCGKGYPDVFTSTYFYYKWLINVITTT